MVTVIDVLEQCKDLCGKVCTITCDAACCEGSLVPEDEANKVSKLIEELPTTIGQISDGYHTFDELYEHRHQLFIALCQEVKPRISVFKTMKHADGTMYAGWFLLMMVLNKGRQISYHLPMRLWDQCDFSEREYAPEFDGHTSADVLERLRLL